MKLTEKTMQILKNFAGINPNMYIHEGVAGEDNYLTTKVPEGYIVGRAQIEEVFPRGVAIYDLNEFLNTLSLFKDPELIMDENDGYIKIKESKGRTSVRYHYTDEDIVEKVPKAGLTIGEPVVEFVLSEAVLSQILKAASVMQLEDIVVRPDGDSIVLSVQDLENSSSNTFEVVVGENTAESDYELIFSVNNFRFLEDGYTVEVDEDLIAHFKGTSRNIEYWVALEDDSSI